MTFDFRSARSLCALSLAALLAAPIAAAQKTKPRAVAHPSTQKITVSGRVTDAITGQVLKGVSLSTPGAAATTDDTGRYAITATPNAELAASRVGYVTVKKTASGTTVDFALPQTPSVTVKLTSGDTVVLDYVTTKFGYADIFQYVSDDGLRLCKDSGEIFTVTKDQMVKITGPAHPVTVNSCCTRGPIMAIDLQTKDGQTTTSTIVDTCFGIVYDVAGVERSSATAKYLHLSDVSQITFP